MSSSRMVGLTMFFGRILFVIVCFASTSALADALARLIPEHVEDCSRPCTRTAIIFVHGITGDRSTWLNGTTNSYWPLMLSRDNDLKSSADIYRIDYEGGMFDGPAVVPISNSVDGLLDSLILLKQYSKIIFIAHSLGGNIVRSYLVHVTARYGHKALSRIRLVVTLGTRTRDRILRILPDFYPIIIKCEFCVLST
jgi:pimeloyl-ACP methyl ester carboxylesterase